MSKLINKKRNSLSKMMCSEICKAALEIIKNSGLSGLTMDKIAENLGTAKGTLYYYFKNKDSLLQETVKMISLPLLEDLRKVNKSEISSKDKLIKAARLLVGHYKLYRDFHFTLHEHYGYKLFEQENIITARKEIRKNIKDIIKNGIDKEEIVNVPIDIATENFIGIIMHFNFNKSIAEAEETGFKDKEIDEVLELFFSGINIKKIEH